MTTQLEQRIAHPYHMHDMIQGQPDAIRRLLLEEQETINSLAASVASSSRVHIVGIGTSWHASLVGEWLLRVVGGREDARAWNSFEFCAYPLTLGPEDIVIVMSHRGTKRYSAQSLELAKNAGARTALFTGLDSGANTDLADHVIHTSIQDRSSAFTISHTAAMAGLAMLASAIGIESGLPMAKELQSGLTDLPELVEGALAQEPGIRKWAARSKNADRFYFAGWGANASTAYEVALKIKESSYLRTEGFQLEQYLHGPFVATESGSLVTFVAPPGYGRERTIDLIQAVKATGGDTSAIVEKGDDRISGLADIAIPMPVMPEPLTPIVYLTALQLFTYWLAVESEKNPDTFRLNEPEHNAARENYQL